MKKSLIIFSLKVSSLLILTFIIFYYDEDERVPIRLGCPFFATRGAFLEVREGMTQMRLTYVDVEFRAFKELNTPLHHRDRCII